MSTFLKAYIDGEIYFEMGDPKELDAKTSILSLSAYIFESFLCL